MTYTMARDGPLEINNMPLRDLSQKQFESRLHRQGFRRSFFGYWHLPPPNDNTKVYARNGGDRRRDQARYLERQAEKREQETRP